MVSKEVSTLKKVNISPPGVAYLQPNLSAPSTTLCYLPGTSRQVAHAQCL